MNRSRAELCLSTSTLRNLALTTACGILLSGCGGGDGSSRFNFFPSGINFGTLPPIVLIAAVVDIDRDGAEDIVAILRHHEEPDRAFVMFQNPDNPGEYSRGEDSPITGNWSAVAVGNFDDDDYPDLAVLGSDSHELFLLLQDPEVPGTTFPAIAVGVDGEPISVTASDIDGDTLTDLAIVRDDFQLVILLRDPNGPGIFREQPPQPAGGSTVKFTDLDGDGRVDAVSGSDGFVSVSRQRPPPAAPAEFLAPEQYRVGRRTTSFATGDLDSDGLPDIAATRATRSVGILYQNATGDASFLPAQMLPSEPPAARHLAIGDLDSDGRDDLAVANTLSVSVFLQVDAQPGTFVRTDYEWELGSDRLLEPEMVVLADYNNDGLQDIGVTSDTHDLWIWTQLPDHPGRFGRRSRIELPD